MNGPSRRWFEEIEVGEESESPGRTVTEADIVIFAGLSGDYNILHTDAEYMKSSFFGERIAHGLLVLSIQQGLLERGRPARAREMLVGIKWKFKGPVKIGDTLHVRARITSLRDSDAPGWGTVLVEREVVVAGQIQEAVKQHRAMPGREHEAVAVAP